MAELIAFGVLCCAVVAIRLCVGGDDDGDLL